MNKKLEERNKMTAFPTTDTINSEELSGVDESIKKLRRQFLENWLLSVVEG
jgi:hypothetical protein